MSLAEIEAELGKLTPGELRHLALRSWTAFVEREGLPKFPNACDEEDAGLLAALDKAIARADASPDLGCSGDEVRARIAEWTSK